MDELEARIGKITLWEWTREWLDECDANRTDADEKDQNCPLEEYLWMRAENQEEVDACK